MNYLENFLGVTCWRCNVGYITLFNKNSSAYLACSNYPQSCQFTSASSIECPACGKGTLKVDTEDDKSYLLHSLCNFKSEIRIERKEYDYSEIAKIKNQGLLIDYLSTLSFDQLNIYWTDKIWESPDGLPVSDDIDQVFIKEAIRKVRSVKWKLLNKI